MDQLVLFDYAQLDTETRIVVQQRSSEIKALMKRTAQSVIEIGEKLIEVKNQLPHGSFGEWLEIEFEWGTSQAARFMQVAERFGDKIYQIDKFSPSALYLLAAPSTPDEARAEAISRAEAGERVTHQAAKEIVNGYKQPANDAPVIVGYTAPRYCGLCGHMQSVRTDEIEQGIRQICSACGEQHLRWQYNAPLPGISPAAFSADGREASVTVTNMDVAGGLAAVMEAEPPAKRDLGYALYPCHMCDEMKIRIDPAGDSVRCEACGQAWGSTAEYHAQRRTWEDYDTPPIEQQRAAREAEYLTPGDTANYRYCRLCGTRQIVALAQDGSPKHQLCLSCRMQHRQWDLTAQDEPKVARPWTATVVEADGSLVPNSLAVHHSSKSVEHYTPPEIVDAVIEVMGAITLDPCSNSKAQPAVRAAIHFTLEDDGLSKEWFGNVYMNPPYGREIGDWVTKLTTEHDTGKVREAIALVPARPDTQWWKQLRDYPVCFVEGRLQFVGNDDPAPFPSAIFYLGTEIGRFYRVFSQYGDVWQRIEPGLSRE